MLVIVTLLQRFEIELAPGQGDPELYLLLSLRPKNALKLKVMLRSPMLTTTDGVAL